MLANDPVTQARIDLTTALRAAVRHGLNEGVCNHFSMTVPGREDLFLVNPQGLHWSEITPGDLVMADGAGNIVEGKYQVEATAFFIHARNDYSTHAGTELAAAMAQQGRPQRLKIYPAVGNTAAEGHDFVHLGVATWEPDVFDFLDGILRPRPAGPPGGAR